MVNATSELSDLELKRIGETVDMIPQDITTILEVGCGDGRLSRAVDRRIHSIGIDIDLARMSSYPSNKIIGDVARLPVKSHNFDIVLCSEVLEHLNDRTFLLALEEIERVATKYILITVPFEETLSAQWCKCSNCNYIFHGWGHVKRFNLATLKSLFGNSKLVEERFLSPCECKMPSLAYVLTKRLGNVWKNDSVKQFACPKCGSHRKYNSKGNIFGMLLIRILWRYERICPTKKPIWVGCLYRRS